MADFNSATFEIFCRVCCSKFDSKYNAMQTQLWECAAREIPNLESKCCFCNGLLKSYPVLEDMFTSPSGQVYAVHCVRIDTLEAIGFIEDKPRAEDLSR